MTKTQYWLSWIAGPTIRDTDPEDRRLAVPKGPTATLLTDTTFALIGSIKYLIES